MNEAAHVGTEQECSLLGVIESLCVESLSSPAKAELIRLLQSLRDPLSDHKDAEKELIFKFGISRHDINAWVSSADDRLKYLLLNWLRRKLGGNSEEEGKEMDANLQTFKLETMAFECAKDDIRLAESDFETKCDAILAEIGSHIAGEDSAMQVKFHARFYPLVMSLLVSYTLKYDEMVTRYRNFASNVFGDSIGVPERAKEFSSMSLDTDALKRGIPLQNDGRSAEDVGMEVDEAVIVVEDKVCGTSVSDVHSDHMERRRNAKSSDDEVVPLVKWFEQFGLEIDWNLNRVENGPLRGRLLQFLSSSSLCSEEWLELRRERCHLEWYGLQIKYITFRASLESLSQSQLVKGIQSSRLLDSEASGSAIGMALGPTVAQNMFPLSCSIAISKSTFINKIIAACWSGTDYNADSPAVGVDALKAQNEKIDAKNDVTLEATSHASPKHYPSSSSSSDLSLGAISSLMDSIETLLLLANAPSHSNPTTSHSNDTQSLIASRNDAVLELLRVQYQAIYLTITNSSFHPSTSNVQTDFTMDRILDRMERHLAFMSCAVTGARSRKQVKISAPLTYLQSKSITVTPIGKAANMMHSLIPVAAACLSRVGLQQATNLLKRLVHLPIAWQTLPSPSSQMRREMRQSLTQIRSLLFIGSGRSVGVDTTISPSFPAALSTPSLVASSSSEEALLRRLILAKLEALESVFAQEVDVSPSASSSSSKEVQSHGNFIESFKSLCGDGYRESEVLNWLGNCVYFLWPLNQASAHSTWQNPSQSVVYFKESVRRSLREPTMSMESERSLKTGSMKSSKTLTSSSATSTSTSASTSASISATTSTIYNPIAPKSISNVNPSKRVTTSFHHDRIENAIASLYNMTRVYHRQGKFESELSLLELLAQHVQAWEEDGKALGVDSPVSMDLVHWRRVKCLASNKSFTAALQALSKILLERIEGKADDNDEDDDDDDDDGRGARGEEEGKEEEESRRANRRTKRTPKSAITICHRTGTFISSKEGEEGGGWIASGRVRVPITHGSNHLSAPITSADNPASSPLASPLNSSPSYPSLSSSPLSSSHSFATPFRLQAHAILLEMARNLIDCGRSEEVLQRFGYKKRMLEASDPTHTTWKQKPKPSAPHNPFDPRHPDAQCLLLAAECLLRLDRSDEALDCLALAHSLLSSSSSPSSSSSNKLVSSTSSHLTTTTSPNTKKRAPSQLNGSGGKRRILECLDLTAEEVGEAASHAPISLDSTSVSKAASTSASTAASTSSRHSTSHLPSPAASFFHFLGHCIHPCCDVTLPLFQPNFRLALLFDTLTNTAATHQCRQEYKDAMALYERALRLVLESKEKEEQVAVLDAPARSAPRVTDDEASSDFAASAPSSPPPSFFLSRRSLLAHYNVALLAFKLGNLALACSTWLPLRFPLLDATAPHMGASSPTTPSALYSTRVHDSLQHASAALAAIPPATMTHSLIVFASSSIPLWQLLQLDVHLLSFLSHSLQQHR